jgi:hypothetical protein
VKASLGRLENITNREARATSVVLFMKLDATCVGLSGMSIEVVAGIFPSSRELPAPAVFAPPLNRAIRDVVGFIAPSHHVIRAVEAARVAVAPVGGPHSFAMSAIKRRFAFEKMSYRERPI